MIKLLVVCTKWGYTPSRLEKDAPRLMRRDLWSQKLTTHKKGLDAESQGFDQAEWWEHEKRLGCHLQTPRNDGRDTSATKWHKTLVWYWAFVFFGNMCPWNHDLRGYQSNLNDLLFVVKPQVTRELWALAKKLRRRGHLPEVGLTPLGFHTNPSSTGFWLKKK